METNDTKQTKEVPTGKLDGVKKNGSLILAYVVTLGIGLGGAGLMGGGALAYLLLGSSSVLIASFLAGAVLVGLGGVGFAQRLEQSWLELRKG